MKLVNFKLIALFILSYSLALVVFTPLAWIMPTIQPTLKAYGVSVSGVSGSVWSGRGLVQLKSLGSAQLTWQIQPTGLLLLKAPISLTIKNSDIELSGDVNVSPFGVSISSLQGYVDEKALKAFYAPYRIEISGRLQLNDLAADISWKKEMGNASGDLSWSGGPLSIPVGRSVQNYEVPTLFGALESDDAKWWVQVNGSKKQEYIRATLSREGLGTLSINRTLATDMSISIPGNGPLLFDISQQVL